MRVSLECYDGRSALNSPRSVEACRQLGIDPKELLMKPKVWFMQGVSERVGLQRWQHFCVQREELLKTAAAHRLSLIKNTTRESISSPLPRSPSTKSATQDGQDSVAREPDRSTPRRASSRQSSKPRIPPPTHVEEVRERELAWRESTREKVEESLRRAESARQAHLDATSWAVCTEPEVARVRRRWKSREISTMRQRIERLEARLRRAGERQVAAAEHALVTRIESGYVHDEQLAEAKRRVAECDAARRRGVLVQLDVDARRCARALQKVDESRRLSAKKHHEELAAAIQRARDVHAAVQQAQRNKVAKLEEDLETKCQMVHDRREALRAVRKAVQISRKSHVQRGADAHLALRQEEIVRRMERRKNHDERIAVRALEREMLLEARRQLEDDRRDKAQRARRAMEYQKRISHC